MAIEHAITVSRMLGVHPWWLLSGLGDPKGGIPNDADAEALSNMHIREVVALMNEVDSEGKIRAKLAVRRELSAYLEEHNRDLKEELRKSFSGSNS